jgi:hypothetical protein
MQALRRKVPERNQVVGIRLIPRPTLVSFRAVSKNRHGTVLQRRDESEASVEASVEATDPSPKGGEERSDFAGVRMWRQRVG